MTGLLAKRVFWNFYDSLGAYTVIGFATVAAMPGIPAAAAALGSATGSGAAAAVGAALGLVAGFAVAARCVAGTFAFASVGADPDGPPPRSRHFRQGACVLGGLYLRWTLAVGAVLAVLATNAPFYLWLAGRAQDTGARLGFAALGMVFGWLWLTLALFAFALAARPARRARMAGLLEPPEERPDADTGQESRAAWCPETLAAAARASLVIFAIAPALWGAAGLMAAAAVVLGAVSVVGVIFIMPALACVSTTALELAEERHADLLTARHELGPDHPVKAYQHRAAEIATAREVRTPRRTLREMLKPWEP